jgi:hypothetical protein
MIFPMGPVSLRQPLEQMVNGIEPRALERMAANYR